jgi:hypothetical protein
MNEKIEELEKITNLNEKIEELEKNNLNELNEEKIFFPIHKKSKSLNIFKFNLPQSKNIPEFRGSGRFIFKELNEIPNWKFIVYF